MLYFLISSEQESAGGTCLSRRGQIASCTSQISSTATSKCTQIVWTVLHQQQRKATNTLGYISIGLDVTTLQRGYQAALVKKMEVRLPLGRLECCNSCRAHYSRHDEQYEDRENCGLSSFQTEIPESLLHGWTVFSLWTTQNNPFLEYRPDYFTTIQCFLLFRKHLCALDIKDGTGLDRIPYQLLLAGRALHIGRWLPQSKVEAQRQETQAE